MPTLADYLRLAPFSLDELVAATNGVLRGHPRLEVSRRTLRYYIAQGAIPPPVGPPKYARYEAEHLLRAVGLRALSARGRRLEEARRELDVLLREPPEEVARELQSRVEGLRSEDAPLEDADEVAEPAAVYELAAPAPASMPELRAAGPASLAASPVLRLRLTPEITLELPGSELDVSHLRTAEREIRKLLDSS